MCLSKIIMDEPAMYSVLISMHYDVLNFKIDKLRSILKCELLLNSD